MFFKNIIYSLGYATIVTAVTTDQFVLDVSLGKFVNNVKSEGSLVVDVDPGFGAQLNVSIYSFDNYDTLVTAYESYEKAISQQNFGDAVLLAETIDFNGINNNQILNGDIANAIIARAKSDISIFDVWSNSSSTAELSNYFQNLKSLASSDKFEFIAKRDNLQCSGSHVPGSGDCQALASGLHNSMGNQVPYSPRSTCYSSCCVSWSSPSSMTNGDLYGAVARCLQSCIYNDQSCEIRDYDYSGNTCVSNRATGCS
ncbi:hypothetical protein KGF54_001558 [Candida jiufengensis]|uniref:uncharacterized protein n=1 Tax=Candida jiufengensis TaxID=497108 RepID=UPI0022256557|nr:uncharacterized protein KGF54_001558 [Candida jiufengensis]KAI5954997.1 hypothetical protein KGF54_001558 [Candida jiufengensis]